MNGKIVLYSLPGDMDVLTMPYQPVSGEPSDSIYLERGLENTMLGREESCTI